MRVFARLSLVFPWIQQQFERVCVWNDPARSCKTKVLFTLVMFMSRKNTGNILLLISMEKLIVTGNVSESIPNLIG